MRVGRLRQPDTDDLGAGDRDSVVDLAAGDEAQNDCRDGEDRPDLVGCEVEAERDDQGDDRLERARTIAGSRPQIVPG